MKTKILVLSAVVVASLSLYQIENLFIQASVPASNTAATSNFKDALPPWAADSINRLNAAGIIKGYNDGRFGAADKLTRGQVVTMLYRTLKYKNIIQDPDPAKCSFYQDVKDTDYYYLPVCFLVLNSGSTIPNNSDVSLSPGTAVPRAEAAGLIDVILGETILKATNVARGTAVIFKDVPKDNAYFDSIGLMDMAGLMKGKSAGIFDPEGLLNRAEMAVVMDRTLNLLETLKIKELAKTINKEAYMTKCADLIDRQATACSVHENWLVDIQVLKQNNKTKKNEIEINEIVYGPGNRCDSSQVTDTIPGDVQTEFLDNQEAGDGEDIQVLCNVTCIGWDSCPLDEPKPKPTPEPTINESHAYTATIDLTATEHVQCDESCIGHIDDSSVTTTITFNDLVIASGFAGTDTITTSAPFSFSCSTTASGGETGSLNGDLDGYALSLSIADAPSQGVTLHFYGGPDYTYFQDNTCSGYTQDPTMLIKKALEKVFGGDGELWSRVYNINGETVSFGGRDHDAAISNDVSSFEYSGTLTITPK